MVHKHHLKKKRRRRRRRRNFPLTGVSFARIFSPTPHPSPHNLSPIPPLPPLLAVTFLQSKARLVQCCNASLASRDERSIHLNGLPQAWELYAHRRIYAPVKFTARPKIYPVRPKAFSKKKKKSEIVRVLAFLSE